MTHFVADAKDGLSIGDGGTVCINQRIALAVERCLSVKCLVGAGRNSLAGIVGGAIDGGFLIADVETVVHHEHGALGGCGIIPIPVADGVALSVGLDDGAVGNRDGVGDGEVRVLGIVRVVGQLGGVGIEAGHHIQQAQLGVALDGHGEGDAHILAVGIGTAGIGRHELLIDVVLATDVPVVGRCGSRAGKALRLGEAVVEDMLGQGVDEVARGLNMVICVGRVVGVGTVGHEILVGIREDVGKFIL